MSKRPPTGRCVHCLRYSNSLTWDHLFPISWYPDSTPNNIEKWKFPACKACNSEHGQIEEDLLWRLGLCAGHEDVRSSGITDRVLNSLNPTSAKTEREKLVRQRKKDKILKEIDDLRKSFKQFPKESILPNFGYKQERECSVNWSIIPVSVTDLKKFGRKLIRGTTYICDKIFVEKNYMIDVYFTDEKNVKYIQELIEKFGTIYYRGPGIRIGRAVAIEDAISSLYAIEIWGKLKIYGTITKEKFRGHDN